MARIRSIKPEVRISEKVNSWPIACRYFWVLLWGYCDDYGYGRDNDRLIVADAFPLDDSITAEHVSEWMNMIWESHVIERFLVDDSAYFQVINWEEHQKISHPAKQFLPTIHEATEILRRPSEGLGKSVNLSEKTSPKQGAGSREKEQGAGSRFIAPAELESLFDAAYSHWPKKVERKAALDKFRSAAKRLTPEVLADHIIRFGDAYAATTDKRFTPALGVWIGHERWTDELPTAQQAERKPTRTEQNLDFVAQLAREQSQQRSITA